MERGLSSSLGPASQGSFSLTQVRFLAAASPLFAATTPSPFTFPRPLHQPRRGCSGCSLFCRSARCVAGGRTRVAGRNVQRVGYNVYTLRPLSLLGVFLKNISRFLISADTGDAARRCRHCSGCRVPSAHALHRESGSFTGWRRAERCHLCLSLSLPLSYVHRMPPPPPCSAPSTHGQEQSCRCRRHQASAHLLATSRSPRATAFTSRLSFLRVRRIVGRAGLTPVTAVPCCRGVGCGVPRRHLVGYVRVCECPHPTDARALRASYSR